MQVTSVGRKREQGLHHAAGVVATVAAGVAAVGEGGGLREVEFLPYTRRSFRYRNYELSLQPTMVEFTLAVCQMQVVGLLGRPSWGSRRLAGRIRRLDAWALHLRAEWQMFKLLLYRLQVHPLWARQGGGDGGGDGGSSESHGGRTYAVHQEAFGLLPLSTKTRVSALTHRVEVAPAQRRMHSPSMPGLSLVATEARAHELQQHLASTSTPEAKIYTTKLTFSLQNRGASHCRVQATSQATAGKRPEKRKREAEGKAGR